MRKVLFHLNSLEKGGAERVVCILAGQFCQNGYEVVIATEWTGADEYTLPDGVKRIHVGLMKEGGRIYNYLYRVRALRKALKKERPAVVIAFAKKAIYRALTASAGTGIPVILSVRTSPVGNYDHPADRILIPLLYRRAAGAVFQTGQAKSFFPAKLRERAAVIINPIQKAYLGRPVLHERIKEIVQVGRLDQFKDQQILLESMYRVHEKYPDYILRIYGGDSGDGTKEALEESIAMHKAQEYIFLMGSMQRLEERIEKASVFVLSSYLEGMPNALMEAMALGLPVVATDCPCGGPADLIKSGENGILVPVKDAKAMADAIIYLLENPETAEQMGKAARKIADYAGETEIFAVWRDYVEKTLERTT